MKFLKTDYLPSHDPMQPYRGRESELSQLLLADDQEPDALGYLDALEKESHLVDVRRSLEALFSSVEAPEVVFNRLALPYDESLSDLENSEEAYRFNEAFSDAIELIADDTTDWPAMNIDAYNLAVEMGQVPAALQ
jgi:hypothetical protein